MERGGHRETASDRTHPSESGIMKISHPLVLKPLGFVGAQILRLWMRSIRFTIQPLGPDVRPHLPNLAGRYIYAVYHEALLIPTYQFAHPDVCVLISRHTDAQLIANVFGHLGCRVVRGSTNRGGVKALRELLDAGRDGHVAFTPDGPRGPRRTVQPGLVYLAARLGIPIVPTGFGFSKCLRLASWDRFVMPMPFSRAACVSGLPISVPAAAGRDELEYYRQQVEEGMLQATELAERWIETGEAPQVPSGSPLPAGERG